MRPARTEQLFFPLLQHYREIEWELTELAVEFTVRGWYGRVFRDSRFRFASAVFERARQYCDVESS